MKAIINKSPALLLPVLILGLAIGCTGKPEKASAPAPKASPVKDTVEHDTIKKIVAGEWKPFATGDMDHDGAADTAFVYTPAYHGTIYPDMPGVVQYEGCVDGKAYNNIRFSGGYPEIHIDNSLWGMVEPIGDLDDDGINEFIFQTDWFIGSHVNIMVYSFNKRKRQWVVLATNNVYGEDSYKDRIAKIDKTKFRFRIEYMDTIVAFDISKKDSVVPIKK